MIEVVPMLSSHSFGMVNHESWRIKSLYAYAFVRSQVSKSTPAIWGVFPDFPSCSIHRCTISFLGVRMSVQSICIYL